MGELTERERDILAFESEPWRGAGAKEDEIRERFALSWIAYYQQLNALLKREEALAAYPVVVNRLNRSLERSSRLRAAFSPPTSARAGH